MKPYLVMAVAFAACWVVSLFGVDPLQVLAGLFAIFVVIDFSVFAWNRRGGVKRGR